MRLKNRKQLSSKFKKGIFAIILLVAAVLLMPLNTINTQNNLAEELNVNSVNTNSLQAKSAANLFNSQSKSLDYGYLPFALAASCGDNTCDTDEDAFSCPEDCATPGPFCGDNFCDANENPNTCPSDCIAPPTCIPSTEICDGMDNNCDNIIDEGCAPTSSTVNPTSGSQVTYSAGQSYNFRTNWQDSDGISTVTITHNFDGSQATAATSNSGNTYTFLQSGLSAGSYVWKQTATDTQSNSANTGNINFVVNKASSTLTLTVAPSNTITFGTPSTVTCIASSAQVSPVLKRDGNVVSNPEVATLDAKTSYSYTCEAAATQNFTAPTSITGSLTVTKKQSDVVMLIDNVAADKTIEFGASVQLTAQLNDPASGTVEIKVDGALDTSGTSPVSVTKINLGLGNHPVQALFAGNNNNYLPDTDSRTVTVTDTTAPAFTINDGTSTTPVKTDTIKLTVADLDLNTASLNYGFSADSTCDASDTLNNPFANGVNFIVAGNHADFLCAKAADNSGNLRFQLVGQLKTDNTAPTLTQTTAVTTPTNDNTPNYVFNSDEAGAISYAGDCSSLTTIATAGNNTVTFNTLADGSHSNCKITVTDAAGNPSAQLSINTFTVDATPPVFTTGVTNETREFALQNVAQQLVAADAAGVASYVVNNSNFTINSTGFLRNNTQLAVGTYNLNVTATDVNGNKQSSFGVITVVDTTLPVFTTGVTTQLREFTKQPVAQQLVATDAAGIASYIVNNSNFTINSTGFLRNNTQLAIGTYNLNVTATDANGNKQSSFGIITVANTTQEIHLSKLVFDKIKVNTPSHKKIVVNGDTVDKVRPGDHIKVEVEIRNSFADSTEIHDISVEGILEKIDNGNDLEDDSQDFDLGGGDDKKVSLNFDIPYNADKIAYKLRLKASGQDSAGKTHEQTAVISLLIDKKTHALAISKLSLNAPLVRCTRSVELTVKVNNIGENEEDDIVLRVTQPELSLNLKENAELNEGSADDDDNSALEKRYVISVPRDFNAGTYPITARAYYDGTKLSDEKSIDLFVEDCLEVKETIVSQPTQTQRTAKVTSTPQETRVIVTNVENTIPTQTSSTKAAESTDNGWSLAILLSGIILAAGLCTLLVKALIIKRI